MDLIKIDERIKVLKDELKKLERIKKSKEVKLFIELQGYNEEAKK